MTFVKNDRIIVKKNNRFLYIFLIVFLFCKLIYWLFAFPNADEAYYWLWGRFPALSYHDHPAMPSLIQGGFYKIFGKSLFILRLPAFISIIVCSIIYYKLLKRMNYSVNIPLVILTFFSFPLIFLFTAFAWHDYMMITMCLVAGYFWINYLTDKWENKKGKSKDIFLAFIFIGLAAISKYNSVFVALAIITIVLFNKQLHSVLKDYRIYLGIALCILIISPIFIWNFQNQYGSFKFSLEQRTLEPLLKGKFFKGNTAGFILGSVLLIPPFLWWFVIRNRKIIKQIKMNVSFEIVYQKFATHLFLWSSLSFLFLSTFSNVLYYWNLPAYIFILPLWILIILKYKKEKLKAILLYSAVVNILMVFHLTILPLNSFVNGVEDKDNSYNFGWTTVEDKLEMAINKFEEEPQIFTSSYRKASLLSFQLNRTDIYSYSPRFDQFDYWTNDIKYDKERALILSDDSKPLNDELKEVLENIVPLDTIQISRFGYKIKEYFLHEAKIRDKYLSNPDKIKSDFN